MNDAIGEVLSRLGPVKKSPNGWEAKCPAKEHGEDKNPSLSVSVGEQGRVLLCCHKNCTYEAIREGLSMSAPDLAGERQSEGEWTPAGPASAVYDYTDEDGNLLFQVLRTIPKAFRQRRPDPLAKSGWAWRLGDVRRVLYRLPKLIAAVDEGRTIFVCEGEEDVHAAERAGEVATCNPGGAGKWRDDYSPFFAGAEVVVVADRDEAGQGHARQVSKALRPMAQSVIVAEAKSGKDLRDHLRAGLTVDELEVTQRPDQAETPVDLVPDVHDFLAEVDTWDWCVPGLLERRERLMVTGGEGGGKRLRVDEPIATPAGWTTMGALAVGDEVFGRDGRPCRVAYASDVEPWPDAWAVCFTDGTVVEADADHQWLTVDYRARQRSHQPEIRTTAEIAGSIRARSGHTLNHAVPVAGALELPERDLPMDPYLLGVWLGDGATASGLLTLNREDAPAIESRLGVSHRTPSGEKPGSVGARVPGLVTRLNEIGVLGFKHIPEVYLRASIHQRKMLLVLRA